MPTFHVLSLLLLVAASLASAQLSGSDNSTTNSTVATVSITSTVTSPYLSTASGYGVATAGDAGVSGAPYSNGTAGTGGATGVGSPPVAPTAGFEGGAAKDRILGACAALVGICGGMLAL